MISQLSWVGAQTGYSRGGDTGDREGGCRQQPKYCVNQLRCLCEQNGKISELMNCHSNWYTMKKDYGVVRG